MVVVDNIDFSTAYELIHSHTKPGSYSNGPLSYRCVDVANALNLIDTNQTDTTFFEIRPKHTQDRLFPKPLVEESVSWAAHVVSFVPSIYLVRDPILAAPVELEDYLEIMFPDQLIQGYKRKNYEFLPKSEEGRRRSLKALFEEIT